MVSRNNYKYILILGATSDIATPLLQLIIDSWEKCTFYLLARDVVKMQAIKIIIEKQNHQVELITYDLLYPPDIHFYLITHCIVLAGWLPKDDTETNKTLLVNFIGIKAFIDNLIVDNKTSLEHIIITGSIAGVRIRNKNRNYGTAKHALHKYANQLQKDLKNKFAITLIIPGYVKTKMIEKINTPQILTISPKNLAAKYFTWMDKKPKLVYSQPIWRVIALILKTIPEYIIRRLNF